MSVLRSTTFQLEVKNADGTTKMRSFTRSVADADKTVAKLNKELGTNVTATYKSVQSTKELTTQARMQVTAMEKANRVYSSQSELMTHQLALIGKSEAEQASLNTQFKLGASATDEQRKTLGALAEQLSLVQQEEAEVNAASEERIRNAKLLSAENAKQAKNNAKLVSQYTRLNALMTEYNGDVKKVNQLMQLGSNATKLQVAQLNNLIDANRKLTTVQGKTQGSMRSMRGQAQNFGWQMQDVAVQLQMNTDKMVIFSQQGSQLASGFGPMGAVVGMFIAIGGALAGVAMKSGEVAEKQKLLKETVFDTTKYILEQVSANKALSASQLVLIQTADAEKIKQYSKQLAIVNARMEFLSKNSTNSATKLEKQNKEMGKLRATAEGLESQIWDLEESQLAYAESGYTTRDMVKDSIATSVDELQAWRDKIALIGKTTLQTDIYNAKMSAVNDVTKKALPEKIALINQYHREADAADKVATAIKNFTSEYEKTIKQNETLAQEYNRRKNIIDTYVATVGAVNTEAANAYVALEQWKTNELIKEEVKRARAAAKEAKRVEKLLNDADKKIGNGSLIDPRLIEEKRFNDTLKPLIEERNNLQSWEYMKRKKIDALMERENDRHADAMTDAQLEQATKIIGAISLTANSMTATIDLLSSGSSAIEEQMENMNTAQKAMFIFNQGVSAAMAIVDGIALGSSLAKTMGWAAPTGVAFGASIGAAQAGAIMGTTFAGAFDAGGIIPSGQAGIVAEYGDELVGGTMVYNNSSSGLGVTGREDTANMMNGGGMNFTVNNLASGIVDVSGTQIDEKTIDVKIAQHFAKNIDSGVAGVINKPSSKGSKALKANLKTGRKVR